MDMGGTSFDVALVERGTAVTTTQAEIAGHRVALPALESTRSAPAAARSRGSTRVACSRSGRKARAPTRDRRATDAAAPARPSPTPTCSSGISIRPVRGGRHPARRRGSGHGDVERGRRPAWSLGGGGRTGVYTLINTTMANAVGTSRSSAGRTRVNTRSSSPAAPDRCTPARSPPSSRSRSYSCRGSPPCSAPPE